MAVAGERSSSWMSTDDDDDNKVLSLCKIPFWQPTSSSSNTTSSLSYSSNSRHIQPQMLGYGQGQIGNFQQNSITVSSIAKSLLPPRRRLRLDPSNKLFFPYEPGKQVRSAISIKNICKSHVAFKFQTTAPKSCYMRPPGGILAPGETLVAVVFKFVEPPDSNEKPLDQKSRVKFKIMSLKVKGDQLDYIPELDIPVMNDQLSLSSDPRLQEQLNGLCTERLLRKLSTLVEEKKTVLFEEQRDQVSVEQILRVVFVDAERPSSALEKLKRQLAEADAAVETRRKPQDQEAGPRIAGEGLIIDEWKERRERYLAQQHGKLGTDSL